MASNGTCPDCGNSNNNTDNSINYAALVIALVALVGTTLQVLQQYLASAGYSSVGQQVMGGWATTKKRRFRFKEFRFEVLFDSPVIFVSPPDNTNGPLRNTPIFFLDGNPVPDVAALTKVPKDADLRPEHDPRSSSSVSTAYNERATWLTLLNEIQTMEHDSMEWQSKQHRMGPPCGSPPAPFGTHSLCVAIQRKKRSWDMMPSSVKKPYATTTMCHVVEIAAMMGMHWLEFDRIRNRFLAVGNGLSLTGRHVEDLGPMFTFHIYQQTRWQQNKCIPVDAVKDLCFGFLPTIFRREGQKNIRRLDPGGENRDLGLLQLGSTDDVGEAMTLLGCNTDTANFFRSQTAQHTHLFPLAFELVGMLGQVMHLKDTCFRMLPNPTPYHWDKKFFSLRRLVIEFRDRLQDAESYDLYMDTPQMEKLLALAEKIVDALGNSRVVHGHSPASSSTYDKAADYSFPLLHALHDAIDDCDSYLRYDVPEDLIVMVVREHLQHVMAMLNATDQTDDASSDVASRRSAQSPGRRPDRYLGGSIGASDHGRTRHFAELGAASPELRQEKFMDLYFSVVLEHVREQAVRAFRRRKSTDYSVLLPPYRSRAGSISGVDDDRISQLGESERGSRAASPTGTAREAEDWPTTTADHETRPATPGGPSNGGVGTPPQEDTRPSTPMRRGSALEVEESRPATAASRPRSPVPELRVTRAAAAYASASPRGPRRRRMDKTEELDMLASTIWCTLHFRMLLWLTLHDFHKKDVQISKSELYGSRLPVYIA